MSSPLVIGLSGAHRGGTAALVRDGRLLAVCDEERITRSRSPGLLATGLPRDTIAAAAHAAGLADPRGATIVVAEPALLALDAAWPVVDHHRAHAVTASAGAPDGAIVLVCDRAAPALSLWRATADGVSPIASGWRGPGFADVYADLARAMGFTPRDEYKVEALARVGRPHAPERAAALVSLGDDGLRVDPAFVERVAAWVAEAPAHERTPHLVAVAAALQDHLAALVVAWLVRVAGLADDVCLGGGLFHNTAFTTAVARALPSSRVRVPVDPGNAGVAAGAALLHAGPPRPAAPSPFLGPNADRATTKATLDNCKLSYDYDHAGATLARVIDALGQGRLVGWFEGRMEWGRRALGHRTTLASPVAPYILENLNGFLKRRDPHVAYGLAVCEEDLDRYFEGPAGSAFMQFEYTVRDPELFRAALPAGARSVRVQTVGAEPTGLRRVLKAVGEAGRPPVVVNTSFNAYREPIVCTPRDATRAFYGTGLDLLVMEGFVLSK